jgi:hypothetical protein
MRRLLKVVLVLVVMAAVLVGGYAIFFFYRPDLYVTGLNRYVTVHASGQKWGTPIPLIPAVFDDGASRSGVERTLRWSGYAKHDWTWQGLKPSFEGGEVVWRNANRFPCNIRYYVVTRFDAADRLERAEALVHERGCL